MLKEIILNYMNDALKNAFENIDEYFFEEFEEIRIRVDKPIIILCKDEEYFINNMGELIKDIEKGRLAEKKDIDKMLELITGFSLYAFEDELKNGYLTIPGGHRVGVTGRAVTEKGYVKTLKNINGLNLRISHEIKGCSKEALKYIVNDKVMHTLIISPPGCGKTTLLRDIIRQLSNGVAGFFKGMTVSVVDERSEIAGSYMGVPQNDIGIRTDVLDACPKAEAMIMLLRSMSPKVIAVDEIGKKEDIYAITDIINAGIKLICTVHGNGIYDIKTKPILSELVEKNIFERFIVLGNLGEIKNIYNKDFEDIYTKA